MSAEPTTAVVVQPESHQTTSALTLIRPIAQPTDLLALHDDVTAIIQKNLTLGIDYAAIPGTGDKPSLHKPGAEKLNLAFGAVAEIEVFDKEVDHDRAVRWTKRQKVWRNKFQGDKTFEWKEVEGTSFGLYRYVIICKLVREGRILAQGVGACSTLESKYIDRPRDCENVVFKMAKKRAYVDATLTAYALSNRFTQDIEDLPRDHVATPQPIEAEPPKPSAEKRGTGYDGSTLHQEALKKTLATRGVPEDRWEEVHDAMMGKTFTQLDGVLAEMKSNDP